MRVWSIKNCLSWIPICWLESWTWKCTQWLISLLRKGNLFSLLYCFLLSRTNMCQFYNPKRQTVFNVSNTINYIFQLDSFHWWNVLNDSGMLTISQLKSRSSKEHSKTLDIVTTEWEDFLLFFTLFCICQTFYNKHV